MELGSAEPDPNITIDQSDVKNNTGEIELNIENLALKRGMVSGFELTETAFSQAVLHGGRRRKGQGQGKQVHR